MELSEPEAAVQATAVGPARPGEVVAETVTGADGGALAAATGTLTVHDGRDSFAPTAAPTGRRIRARFPFGFPAASAVAGATGF